LRCTTISGSSSEFQWRASAAMKPAAPSMAAAVERS
jgi:hypothetical protein